MVETRGPRQMGQSVCFVIQELMPASLKEWPHGTHTIASTISVCRMGHSSRVTLPPTNGVGEERDAAETDPPPPSAFSFSSASRRSSSLLEPPLSVSLLARFRALSRRLPRLAPRGRESAPSERLSCGVGAWLPQCTQRGATPRFTCMHSSHCHTDTTP